ncbi:hypothetical protein G9A89_008994 [Geosiphon pyriformis]|nr:hypothetical protein G9A89_008994 [Geosiphon pyriformis]
MVFFLTKTKLKASAGPWIKDKFEDVRIFMSGLEESFLGADVAVVLDSFLAQHVLKIEEVSGQVISVHLLFKNKLLVIFLDLYAGASAKTRFAQAFNVNSFISKAVNTSSFVIIDEDFNKDSARKYASFRKCSDLELVNSLGGHFLTVVGHSVTFVSEFFDTDHNMVGISVGLESLVNAHLNGIRKQTNKDHWKYKIKDVDAVKWGHFRDCSLVRLSLLLNIFLVSKGKGDLDEIWKVLRSAVCDLADETFFKHWFCEFDCLKNKQFSKFFKLESLVAKITKGLCSGKLVEVEHLVQVWSTLDAVKASEVAVLLENGSRLHELCSLLLKTKKCYWKSKYHETELARCKHIKDMIKKHMESFNSNKSKMIRSVLECLFRKVVLNHLVVNDELILDPVEVWSKVDKIMVDWTHRQMILLALSVGDVLDLWKRVWVFMIPKPYEWDGILINTRPIALIETAKKILSKILSDWIFSVYNRFDILYDDNFSVLKGTLTQSPMFAVGSIVEDALEKDQKIWLDVSLHISGQLISVAKKSESHRYLGIFLSTEDLSKPSLAKTHADVRFFFNLVLRKTVLDKQFSYLVSAVLQPIVYYCTQFSFVAKSVCQKWNIMIKKGLKAKAFLPKDFFIKALHHPSLYSLKPFEQVQAEAKVASVISFSNALKILSCLFEHHALDLQVLSWILLNLLCHLVKLRVCLLNNFLAGIMRIFLDTDVSLVNKLLSTFYKSGHFPMLEILGASCYFEVVCLLKHFVLDGSGLFCSDNFLFVHKCLHEVWAGKLNIFIDGSLSGLGTLDVAYGAAAYFFEINLGINVRVQGLLSFTLVEFQVTLDACISEYIIVRFLVADGLVVSGNARHFIHDVCRTVCCVLWEAGSSVSVLASSYLYCIDWECTAFVWHLDSYMLAGFTNRKSAALRTYLMKTVHGRLLVAVCKRLYDIGYPSVLCLMCGDIKFSDYAFTCSADLVLYLEIVADHIGLWKSLAGVHLPASFSVLTTLANASDVGIYTVLCKDFVF